MARSPFARPRVQCLALLSIWTLACDGAPAAPAAPAARTTEFAAANRTPGASGAEADDAEHSVRGTEQGLIGGTFFDDAMVEENGASVPGCSDDDKAMFRQIMTLGRTVALGSAIRDCVRMILVQGDGTFGPYHTCPSDPYVRDSIEQQVQGVLDVLTTPNPVKITCTTGNIGVTRVAGRHDLPAQIHEPFEIPNPPLDQLFDADWLSAGGGSGSATREELDFRARIFLIAPRSALVWHEAMHVHAYRHDCPNQTYFQSVPYMVQYCLQQVAQKSVDRCDMRGGCATGGERAIIDSYPVTADTGCECLRDAVSQGKTDLPATPILDTSEPGDRFGAALAAGDFNGDGFADLAVGAPGEDGASGKVFVYLGSVLGLYAERVIDQSELGQNEAGDEFGTSLVAFDLDRDQLDDLVVGAPGEDLQTGAVYLFRGTRDGLTAQVALGGKAQTAFGAGSRYGEALAASTFLDVTRPVLAVGAPGLKGGKQAGTVHLLQGADVDQALVTGLATLQPAAPAGHPGDRFGAALAFGSLASATPAALAVGAPEATGGGAVYVLLPLQSSTVVVNARLEPSYALQSGSGEPEGFGRALAFGRAAGPGTLLVGAPRASASNLDDSGRVYLWRASSADAALLHTLDGDAQGGQLGSALLATGRYQVFDEFLASAPFSDHAAVKLAKAAFDEEALDFRAQWGAAPESTGPMAFTRGDFDGSGMLDLVVGVPDEPATSRGPVGGYIEVYRRTDDGSWAPWGHYRQGE
ncbi:MAG: FG-GAP repeat protein [Myxococcales bacterium]